MTQKSTVSKEVLRKEEHELELQGIPLKFSYKAEHGFFIADHHVVALFPRKPNLKIMGIDLEKWKPADTIIAVDDEYHIQGERGISGRRFQSIIPGEYFDLFRFQYNLHEVYLHPNSDRSEQPILLFFGDFVVIITTVEKNETI